jgi:peptidoglycan/LPS O-acetylase OafA/YrhL
MKSPETTDSKASHSNPQGPNLGTAVPQSARYRWLDAWRGIACLMLIVYHAMFYVDPSDGIVAGDFWHSLVWAARRMWIGVPIFFVISGYCIAGSVRSLQDKPGGLRQFAFRRFFRIYPPLWTACALAALIWLAADSSDFLSQHCLQIKGAGDLSVWQWIGNLTATESWLHHLSSSASSPNYLMGIIWTLCYEEQFYLIAALMLIAFRGKAFSGAVMVTVFSAVLFMTGMAASPSLAGFFIDGHWLLFAFGWAAHRAIHDATKWGRFSIMGVLLIASAAALLHMRNEPSESVLHFDQSLASAALFSLLLIIAHPWDALLSKARLTQPFAAVGKMSYSIYLTHYAPVTLISAAFAGIGLHSHFFTFAIVLPLSFLVSGLVGYPFYRLIEQRFSFIGKISEKTEPSLSGSITTQKAPC